MENFYLILGLSLVWAHELDAIRRREWKIFFIIGDWEEEKAYWFWIFAHIPLFFLSYYLFIPNESSGDHFIYKLGLDIFFIVHLLLHIFLAKHRENRFQSFGSKFLIFTVGICGILDLYIQFF